MSKRVLMVLDEEFPPDERVFKETQTLIASGFEVHLACYTFTNRPGYEIFKGVHIYRKKIGRLTYKSSVAALKFPMYFIWWKVFLGQIFKKQTFDIIHIHDLPLTKVGIYFKEKYNLKLVVDLHENWPAYLEKAIHVQSLLGKMLSSNSQWRRYERDVLKPADLIITVVEEMKERITALGHNPDKIVVLHNAIIRENYPLTGLKPDPNFFTLFYAGDITRIRGIQTILDDLAEAKKVIPGLRFYVLGKGNFLSGLQDQIKERGLADIFQFLGWKPLTEVMQLLEQSDVGVMPHLRWEQTDFSSPNKLFQYMHAQRPSLCSPSNSINRIIDETKSGLVYDYHIKGDFLEKLLFLYHNSDECRLMGENGNRWVTQKYNWKLASNEFLAYYLQL
jgi:glycosyltransferase involved in cell wall biosynthesis